ncbi:hypothetical protein PIB30_031063 [Stylosanthes scabra]|uniref:PORR domain-containing protein n=1 Tax=Stylosanthes scabra TaxID=79078 RepID=A0ABU6RC93_9FABA|nr:hypothetical protein [Stylosanthes scabra]
MLRHVPFPSSRGNFEYSPAFLLHTRQKSSGGSRPKKKVYHRVSDLDRVMELRKKPSLILELSSIIQSHKTQSLLLRDLEKNVGFVRKWDFMALIERYPTIFRVYGSPPSVSLTLKAQSVAQEEVQAKALMEPLLAEEGVLSANQGGVRKRVKISKDGNYMGSFAFKMNFPPGFRPNVSYLENLERWQRMDFPSPYLNARRLDPTAPETRKRAVAVIHELLSLTMEKRMTSVQLDAFQAECHLPSKLLLCLIKHHGIFYLTNKGVRSTVFLKDAYLGSNLIDKCPLLRFNDKFVALSGRRNGICTTATVL